MSFKRKIQRNQTALPPPGKASLDVVTWNLRHRLLDNLRFENSKQFENVELKHFSDKRKNSFISKFNSLTYRHSRWGAWGDFILMSACAISNAFDNSHFTEREDCYLKIIRKYDKKERELFPEMLADLTMALEYEPEQDFLGDIFMTLGLGNRHNGQFFTPYSVCKLMAETSMQDVVLDVKKNGYISINDTCCGAGATLIAAVNVAKQKLYDANMNFQNHVLFVGQDIDQTVGLMCYIQLSLLGAPGYVKIGNSLTDPIRNGDSDENYWYTPMYYSDVWATRRVLKTVGKLTDNAILIDQRGERKDDEGKYCKEI